MQGKSGVPIENSISARIDPALVGNLRCGGLDVSSRLLIVALGPVGSGPTCLVASRDKRRPMPRLPDGQRIGACDYAARRPMVQPPTCGLTTTGPSVGDGIGLGRGESLASERGVRDLGDMSPGL